MHFSNQVVTAGSNIPVNTINWANVVLMMGQCRRRWASSKSTLDQCLYLLEFP